ncbi:hypothetical protein L596_023484 [Steinernema carpocapsae]|uniref:Uncharacterized protein n=1 Tax=Steinernema carpocapsae TaxID=34508 RepID=A0A4U5MDS7_STECR|nr:hypothetical protein L596_023484 [Steinernema carpocapsae]
MLASCFNTPRSSCHYYRHGDVFNLKAPFFNERWLKAVFLKHPRNQTILSHVTKIGLHVSRKIVFASIVSKIALAISISPLTHVQKL